METLIVLDSQYKVGVGVGTLIISASAVPYFGVELVALIDMFLC